MTEKFLKQAIEGMLFIWGEPLEVSEIARALEIDKKRAGELTETLAEEFEKDGRGLVIKKVGDAYQLQTRKELYPVLEKLADKQKTSDLTSTCMETLAIVAYKQPVTRVEVENLRGVSSTSPLNTLQKRGLIEEAGRLDKIGRPILYRTTRRFLKSFNLKDLDDLPTLSPLENYRIEKEEEEHETQ